VNHICEQIGARFEHKFGGEFSRRKVAFSHIRVAFSARRHFGAFSVKRRFFAVKRFLPFWRLATRHHTGAAHSATALTLHLHPVTPQGVPAFRETLTCECHHRVCVLRSEFHGGVALLVFEQKGLAARLFFSELERGIRCSVRLERIEYHPSLGPVLHVLGADLLDSTPIYDIKPYVPYADAHPEARGGFVDQVERKRLSVDCPAHLLERAPLEKRDALLGVLAEDPRPSYQEDPDRVYGMAFAGMEVKFSVDGERLTVRDIHAAK